MDSFCDLKGCESGGYFLRIGDDIVENTWAVTGDELRALKDLLNKEFPNDQ